MLSNLLNFRAEIARALTNRRYERTDDGRIYVAGPKLMIGGTMAYSIDDGPRVLGDNTATYEGLDNILSVYFTGTSAATGFYFVPYTNNVAPDATITAATFNSTLGEFTNYTATTRQQWNPGSVSSQSVDNSASTAQLVLGTGGGTIRGAGLSTASVKSATTGVLVVVAPFTDPAILTAGSKLNLEYVLTAQDV